MLVANYIAASVTKYNLIAILLKTTALNWKVAQIATLAGVLSAKLVEGK